MKEGPKFLSEDQLKKRAVGWKSQVANNEPWGFRYTANRKAEGDQSIAQFHGVSFIKDIIPQLIAGKKDGEKVRILDVGAGAALFTDEIRKTFGKDVLVFSTGLSKSTAKNYREENLLDNNSKLHPNDLKWRSILEFSDFEEFDLIIDTFGEYTYALEYAATSQTTDINTKEALAEALTYLSVVIKKLKPGGLASIVPIIPALNPAGVGIPEVLQKLEKEFDVKIAVSDSNPAILRIRKKPTLK